MKADGNERFSRSEVERALGAADAPEDSMATMAEKWGLPKGEASDYIDPSAPMCACGHLRSSHRNGECFACAGPPCDAEDDGVWVEWGVRRTWGPQVGEVSSFERDYRTARKCAKNWPGTLVARVVSAGGWESGAAR
jgi:hypothetical protein